MNCFSPLKFFVTECRLLMVGLWVLFPIMGQAQNEYERCLQKAGFENVAAYASHDTLTATLENINYRGNYRGIGQAIKALSACDAQIKVFRLLVQEYQKRGFF